MKVRVFKELKPNIVLYGLYDKYLLYVGTTLGFSFLLIIFSFQPLPFTVWCIITFILIILNVIIYFNFRLKTVRGEVKNYPCKQGRIFNNNLCNGKKYLP